MNDDDGVAARRYEDAAWLVPSGPGRRLRANRKAMTSHVAVRFAAETIGSVKRFADEDGITVSTWIRNLVNREVQRRGQRPVTYCAHVPRGTDTWGPLIGQQFGPVR